jgi:hypothetical protein
VNLNEGVLTSIVYTSESKNETKTRSIVPVTVPKDSVRAIDVSALPTEEQELMATLVAGYKEYLAGIFTGTFKFEDWVEHTTGMEISPSWRTFKVSNIKVSE